MEFKRTLVALVLFGVSFGYVEASLVVYLRDVYDPLTLELDPERKPGDVFPLITLEQLEAADAEYMKRLRTEVVRSRRMRSKRSTPTSRSEDFFGSSSSTDPRSKRVT